MQGTVRYDIHVLRYRRQTNRRDCQMKSNYHRPCSCREAINTFSIIRQSEEGKEKGIISRVSEWVYRLPNETHSTSPLYLAHSRCYKDGSTTSSYMIHTQVDTTCYARCVKLCNWRIALITTASIFCGNWQLIWGTKWMTLLGPGKRVYPWNAGLGMQKKS